jgi:hypothetical protein
MPITMPASRLESGGASVSQALAERLWQVGMDGLTTAELRQLLSETDLAAMESLILAESYRHAASTLLKRGENFLAFEIASKAVAKFPAIPSGKLRHIQALALARSGSPLQAQAVMKELYSAGHRDPDTMGLLARTHKDLAALADSPAERKRHYRKAFEWSKRGHRQSPNYYNAINAAATALLGGLPVAAAQYAREAARLGTEPAAMASDPYYSLATVAEAQFILGDLQAAKRLYRRASAAAGRRIADLASTARQARLLLEAIGRHPHEFDGCFDLPVVMVASGHLLDTRARARQAPRFPPSLEPAVAGAMAKRLDPLKLIAGYCSAACGADILFAELLLRRGVAVHLFLPFPAAMFKRVSVALAGKSWSRRFDRVMEEAASITFASKDGGPVQDTIFRYCNDIMNGMAWMKAQSLSTRLLALAVWDGQPGGVGGTGEFVAYWRKRGVEPITIDPAKLQ